MSENPPFPLLSLPLQTTLSAVCFQTVCVLAGIRHHNDDSPRSSSPTSIFLTARRINVSWASSTSVCFAPIIWSACLESMVKATGAANSNGEQCSCWVKLPGAEPASDGEALFVCRWPLQICPTIKFNQPTKKGKNKRQQVNILCVPTSSAHVALLQ